MRLKNEGPNGNATALIIHRNNTVSQNRQPIWQRGVGPGTTQGI